jgi:hypothetical protein
MSTTRSRIRTLAAAMALAALAVPASASGQALAPATGGLEASMDPPRLVVSPGTLLNRTVTIRGHVELADAGRPVTVERRIEDGTWLPIAQTIVGPDGTFVARWRTDTAGHTVVRAMVDRSDAPTATAASLDPLTAPLAIFRPATASWYGPGLYGRRTACGTRLRRTTIGVAHRTLRCGTRVDVYHRGRILTVPVIDRGPFQKGRQWDLTEAAARALGIRGTVRIGVLTPPPAARPASR